MARLAAAVDPLLRLARRRRPSTRNPPPARPEPAANEKARTVGGGCVCWNRGVAACAGTEGSLHVLGFAGEGVAGCRVATRRLIGLILTQTDSN